jgi:hypothetical protein
MSTQRFIVVVANDHMNTIADIAIRLQEAGMTVLEQHEDIGVITGTADSEQLAALRSVEGVLTVGPDEENYTSDQL